MNDPITPALLLQWLGIAIAVIAGLFGVCWIADKFARWLVNRQH